MIPWDDLHTFLVIQRHGSLSAAARALHVNQTTMARRLAAFQDRIGAQLLQRTPTGFILTPAGERVLAHAEQMEAEALTIERAVTGEDVRLQGLVRITTVETFGARIVTPLLHGLHERYPGIMIELIAESRALSLSRREADIALRLGVFAQHETVVSRVGNMAFAVYASRSYLDRSGMPDWERGAQGHTLITLQDDLALLPEARWFSDLAKSAMTALQSNSRDAHLQAALSGCGLACLPRYLGDAADLIRLNVPKPPPVREIWMGVHKDTRHVPRIRAVMDELSGGIKMLANRLNPEM
jgi:DNA-binding transcriptional LysR family regulator